MMMMMMVATSRPPLLQDLLLLIQDKSPLLLSVPTIQTCFSSTQPSFKSDRHVWGLLHHCGRIINIKKCLIRLEQPLQVVDYSPDFGRGNADATDSGSFVWGYNRFRNLTVLEEIQEKQYSLSCDPRPGSNTTRRKWEVRFIHIFNIFNLDPKNKKTESLNYY